MSEIEVLEVILRQIGDLRVPMREKELRDSLDVICGNLLALKTAVEEAQEDKPREETEVDKDV